MNINQQIEMLESKIDAIKSNIENKQSEIDNFEYEISESDFDEFLDEIEQPVNVCGMEFYPSDILKSCDPIAYRCAKSDYESSYDLDDVEEYADLKDELEELESELEELESELEDLNDQLEHVWNKSESRLNGLYWAESNNGEMLSFIDQDELHCFLNK